jgi:hypothetical protein
MIYKDYLPLYPSSVVGSLPKIVPPAISKTSGEQIPQMMGISGRMLKEIKEAISQDKLANLVRNSFIKVAFFPG